MGRDALSLRPSENAAWPSEIILLTAFSDFLVDDLFVLLSVL